MSRKGTKETEKESESRTEKRWENENRNFKGNLGVKLLLRKHESCENKSSCSAIPRIVFLYWNYCKVHFLPSFSDVSADDALLQVRPSTTDLPTAAAAPAGPPGHTDIMDT